MRRTELLIVSTLAFALCAGFAAAQSTPPPADTLKIDYFAYAHTLGAPDGTLRLTNPGTTGTNMCAAIFVADQYQEMNECCSCLLSPNGLRTLSVNTDLTGNSLTGRILNIGSITIVSTTTVNGACPVPTLLTPTSGGVRAWATHIDRLRSGGTTSGFVGTTEASQDATLSSGEQTYLQNLCSDVSYIGSGRGICTCGTGD